MYWLLPLAKIADELDVVAPGHDEDVGVAPDLGRDDLAHEEHEGHQDAHGQQDEQNLHLEVQR